jgi:hypothetical protein
MYCFALSKFEIVARPSQHSHLFRYKREGKHDSEDVRKKGKKYLDVSEGIPS